MPAPMPTGDSTPHAQRATEATSAAAHSGADRATLRYDADALRGYAEALLRAAGVRGDIAHDVAAILVDGDLMGHTTHGLALLPGYLDQLEQGKMGKAGEPRIVASSSAAQ
ncbi:MAG TPA: Ldh family oxidoreductase, partial [Casimicrobiaceae bacterium]|nr:Ldh family oxidoreductase [Casimicrobiaceae bacterium]